MKFVNYATYIDDQVRISEIRPSHVAYLRTVYANGKLIASGPFTDGSGGLFIFETDTLEEAERIVAGDPFYKKGVFIAHRISPWRLVAANHALFDPDT